MHAAMKTHLSQSTSAEDSDGQQGMSLAITSDIGDIDISAAIADVDAADVVPAITGRAVGAAISTATIRIANSRRMMVGRFIFPKSHRTTRIHSPRWLTTP
jgi:hypothetical protein